MTERTRRLCSWAALVLGTTALSRAALADPMHFAVVDISADGHNEKIAGQVERDVARLKPGFKPLEDPSMRRLLATGEGPAAAASRLTREANALRESGDCPAALERVTQAEALTLAFVSLDDERELLRTQYVVMVICEEARGNAAARDMAARRLRNLTSSAPPRLPADLWEKYVAKATPPPATVELHVDSDPPNAQIAINAHGEGVTPRTLKIPTGTVYVEVQKDGFLKGFRKLQVSGTQPVRTAFRLVDRTHDRVDQAHATMNLLRRTEAGQRPAMQTLSRLAQLARADALVILSVANDRAKIWFFDAERGAASGEAIDSPVDPATGKVAALAQRTAAIKPATAPAKPPEAPTSAAQEAPATKSAADAPATPSGGSAPAPHHAPAVLAPTGVAPAPAPPSQTNVPLAPSLAPSQAVPPSTGGPAGAAPKATEGLPDVQSPAQVSPYRRRAKAPTPWWSWLIAGAIGGSLLAYIYLDQPQHQDTLAVRAYYIPSQ